MSRDGAQWPRRMSWLARQYRQQPRRAQLALRAGSRPEEVRLIWPHAGQQQPAATGAQPAPTRQPPATDQPVTAMPPQLPSAAVTALRIQLADFAELAHRHRVPNLRDQPSAGSVPGHGIAPTVVRALAAVLRAENVPGLELGLDRLTDQLMRALMVVPPSSVPLPLSFSSSCGRIRLATSPVADGRAATTHFIRPGERPGQGAGIGSWLAAETAPPQEAGSTPGTAAVICGSAAGLAGGRPYVSVDALTSYARMQALRQTQPATSPHAASAAMRTACQLEIVVLLDPGRDRAVWVDVDPATGRPAAALGIDLTTLGEPDGGQASSLADIDPAHAVTG